MSCLTNNPLNIPQGIEVTLNEGLIKVKGPKGELTLARDVNVLIEKGEKGLVFKANNTSNKHSKAMTGTIFALVRNMIEGVNTGVSKTLEVKGVGYRVALKGKKLILNLGYSNPVELDIPEGIAIKCPDNTTIIVSGIDKQLVGQFAAIIKRQRKPDAYKGKGVRYKGEFVLIKEIKKK